MGDTITEFMALMKEFGTIVQFNAVAGIAVAVLVFVLEVRWTRSHPPKDKRIEKAIRLGHVVNAKRSKFWDDGLTAAEQTTSYYHADYLYEVCGKQYQYKYLDRVFPPVAIKLYYINNPRRAFHQGAKKHSLSKLLLFLLPIAMGVGAALLLGGV